MATKFPSTHAAGRGTPKDPDLVRGKDNTTAVPPQSALSLNSSGSGASGVGYPGNPNAVYGPRLSASAKG